MRVETFEGDATLATLAEAAQAMSRGRRVQDVLDPLVSGMRRAYGNTRGFIWLRTAGLPSGSYRITQRIEPHDFYVPTGRNWMADDEAPIESGRFFADLIARGRPHVVHEIDDPAVPGIGSLMATPIFGGGETRSWAVVLDPGPDTFDADELNHFVMRINLVATAARNTRLAQELQEAQAFIQAEIDQIASIQKALLPATMPHIEGLDLDAHFESFDRAGGDFYDIFRLPTGNARSDLDGPWALFIADASGHGPHAAVLVALMHGILHAYPKRPEGPAELLTHLNIHLHAKQLELTFVTAFLAFYDPLDKTLTYARAGHNPPLLYTPGERPHELRDIGGLPLGIEPGAQYPENARQLTPGETLLLYTDGITETMSDDGEQFGLEGLERALAACTKQNPG